VALNYRAYDGYFQDDEMENLAWAPLLPMTQYLTAVLKPVFDVGNFRPPGHLYFTLIGRAFGMDFPPYITPIFAIHLANAILLFLLLRKLAVSRWCALGGVAFFALSATAMDAYWKPMYVFDLLCTTFSLASILLFAYRRWILSFIAFWLAYKSKELAVMLPVVLLAYEYWLGERRYAVLVPFFVAALSFGLQGLLLNPNKNNEYTFRFGLNSLWKTIPFYSRRLFFIPFSGLALLALGWIRDRRVWFGLAAMLSFLFVLLFLPGRLFEAYAYLPLACAAIAIAAAAERAGPRWLWIALLVWLPWNVRELHREQRAILDADDDAAAYVDQLQAWAGRHPATTTLIYNVPPRGYHHWGVTGAWNIGHHGLGFLAYFHDRPEAAEAMSKETVALATWDSASRKLDIEIHPPPK